MKRFLLSLPPSLLAMAPLVASAQISTLPSPSPATTSVSAAARNATTTLWDITRSGGWAMIPLAALSVLTVMLVLVYLFTLRRGSIVSAHFMNTADVLLKKRDYPGLLAISSRHSESIARVVQRTLDFATRNPNAEYQIVR